MDVISIIFFSAVFSVGLNLILGVVLWSESKRADEWCLKYYELRRDFDKARGTSFYN